MVPCGFFCWAFRTSSVTILSTDLAEIGYLLTLANLLNRSLSVLVEHGNCEGWNVPSEFVLILLSSPISIVPR